MPEIFQLQAKDVCLKINQYAAINAIQNFDVTSQFNEQEVEELGNPNVVAQANYPELQGSFEALATGSTVALLRRMITKTDATGKFLGYLAGQETAEAEYATNVGTIRSTDLERAVFDLTELKRPNEIFSEATVLPRVMLSQVQFNLDAQGMARETYSFEGEVIRLYGSPRHDVTSLPAVFVDANTAQVPIGYEVVKDDATATGAQWVIRFVQVDDRILPAAAIASVTRDLDPATVGDKIIFAAGYEIEDSDRISVVIYKKTPGSFPSIDYPTSARFVKADAIDVFLIERTNQDAPGDNSLSLLADGALVGNALFTKANRLLRVQSANLSINLSREKLNQLALTDTGNSTYFRSVKFPLDITASANCLETDYATWAKLQGVNLASAGSFLDLEQFEGKTWQLVFQYYYQGTPVQAMALCNARVSGPGHRVGAGARAELNWSFKGSDWVVEGITF